MTREGFHSSSGIHSKEENRGGLMPKSRDRFHSSSGIHSKEEVFRRQ